MEPIILMRAWQVSRFHSEYADKMSVFSRLKYLAKATKYYKGSICLFDNENAFIQECLQKRPEYYQIITAPYINSTWNLNERVNRLVNHLSALQQKNWNFDFEYNYDILILDLSVVNISGYRIILDKPIWFHREGVLALNIFKDDIRIYTLSFSIEKNDNELAILVGGIQGRNIDNILDEYRILTKLLYGIRPRDFIIELLRIFGNVIGVSHIAAISDECRHQRHPYFGKNTTRPLPANYNEIWTDRGGVRESYSTYALPMNSVRDIDAVAAKKRSMYKKRYELLRQIEHEIIFNFSNLVPKPALEAK